MLIKIKLLLIIMIIVLIFVYYNLELYIISELNYNHKIMKFCCHPLLHLGDNIYNIFLFNKLKKYIEKNNIIIEYYCNKNYHGEMIDMKNSNNIIIHDFKPLGYHLSATNLGNLLITEQYINFIFNQYINVLLNQKFPYDVLFKNIFNK